MSSILYEAFNLEASLILEDCYMMVYKYTSCNMHSSTFVFASILYGKKDWQFLCNVFFFAKTNFGFLKGRLSDNCFSHIEGNNKLISILKRHSNKCDHLS